MGWILEMVTSSLGSSFSRAQEEVKEAVPPSVSHLDPNPSPTVNGLSLYLKTSRVYRYYFLKIKTLSEADKLGGSKDREESDSLWRSRGEAWLVKQVQFGASGWLGSRRSFLLDHLHLWHHRVGHGTARGNTHTFRQETRTQEFWRYVCAAALPPVAKAHAQPLGLLPLLALQVLQLLLLHLSVNL